MRYFLLALLTICLLESQTIEGSFDVYRICVDEREYVVTKTLDGGTSMVRAVRGAYGDKGKECNCSGTFWTPKTQQE